jgi:4-hydroxy-tetrahydrodipicolinate synthase
MKKTVFQGVATALITPMKTDGSVDWEVFGRLVDFQLAGGINALVACGTTGESSTLTDEEHREAIAFVVERVAGRVPVIAGTGSNDTAYALELSKFACEAGADALLIVTPYYNKATQAGLIRMYSTIADAATKPVILYNVPSRTGVNIEPTTYRILAEHDNIVAIKEANGNIGKIVETMSYVQGKLDLYSGNDDQIVPLLSLGGKGVISVLSNLLPAETVALCNKFFAGDIAGAAQDQFRYHALIDSLFSEVNPIPVKAAMAAMGYGTNTLRLPLTPMNEEKYERMLALMRAAGIQVK